MRKAVAMSFVAVFVSALSAYAQALPPPPHSTQAQNTVPDLSGKSWNLVVEFPADLSVDTREGQGTGRLGTTVKVYENQTDNMEAEVLMWNGEEVAMLYQAGTEKTFAIKVKGKWYVAKDKSQLQAVAVYGNEGPSGVKLSLDTTDGPREVVLDLSEK